MGFIDNNPTGIQYAFFNEKIKDDFNGTIWRLSKNGTTGNVGTTQDIGFLGNSLDNDAIDTFKGADEIRLNRWYRQDDHGAEPDYAEQTDWDLMHEVVWDTEKEEYVVKYSPIRNSLMTINDSGNLESHTAFSLIVRDGNFSGSGASRGAIYEPSSVTDRRFGSFLGYANDDDASANFDIQIWGTGDPSPQVIIPDINVWSNIVTHFKRGFGTPAEETVTRFMQDGTQFGSDYYVTGSPGAGLTIGSISTIGGFDFTPPIRMKGLIIYDSHLDNATVHAYNTEINSSFIDKSISGNVKENGTNISGARVPIFSATNLELDGLTLEQTVVTDASGNFSSTITLGAKLYIAFPFWNDNNTGKSQKPIILDRR